MNEYDLVRMISRKFPRSPQQRNGCLKCDAELITLGDQLWALTMDDFTPEEDLFSDRHPRQLGANLATATLCDLLAAGARPAFFMQALSLPPNGPPFAEELSLGIASVLDRANCFLCGGDLGTAATWRFCGFAMGPVPDNKALTREIPSRAGNLWVSGPMGGFNLAALTGAPTPLIELRMDSAQLIRRHATSCIDTSGGLLDAAWILSTINPHMRLEIDVDAVPLAQGVDLLTQTHAIPPVAALLGGAGEYELLCVTPADLVPGGVDALCAAGMTMVGTVLPQSGGGVGLRRPDGSTTVMTGPPPCPRTTASREEYIRQVIAVSRKIMGEE